MSEDLKHMARYTLVVAVCLLLAGMVAAQEDPIFSSEPDGPVTEGDSDAEVTEGVNAFGTEFQYTWVTASEFTPLNPDDPWEYNTYQYWCNTSSNTSDDTYTAPLHLPQGALIYGYYVHAYDNFAGRNLGVRLRRWHDNASTQTVGHDGIGPYFETPDGGVPGYVRSYVDIAPNHTYDVRSGSTYRQYGFVLSTSGTTNLRFKGIMVNWGRQVSPAPASATFNDVSTGHWAFRHIEALNDSGISAGCGGGSFCPTANVTRAEMAIFLAKALGLHFAP